MPRFGDQWVVDRTMFDFAMGGSCACCGFNHFLPDGTAGMINAMSDLETDAANAEIAALKDSPWPREMRDDVWANRLKLRYKMKKEMKDYQAFWLEHGQAFSEWLFNFAELNKYLQCPRAEITQRVGSIYSIHGAFSIVLCTVMEQVVHFPITGFDTDGREETEIAFEKHIIYDRRGGFTMKLNMQANNNDKAQARKAVIQVLLDRIQSLGKGKLLARAPKKVKDESDEEDGDADEGGINKLEDDGDAEYTQNGPSFRADRRMIRLLLARYWADQLKKRYLSDIGAEPTS